MDFGAVYNGYHSDITRTVVVGKASARQREIYDLVRASHRPASTRSRPARPGAKLTRWPAG
jgi:Xaa-Pro aminopeptidase